jgi:hypothetical protein
MEMVPSFIEENSPPGERILFSRLQGADRNWITLHSLDLAPYNNNRRTELDFVLIIPERGIMCVEVKSQKDIFFDGSIWHPKSIKSSPFKQALNARFALRRRLKDKFGSKFSRIPVIHCCIFPCSDFSVDGSVSVHEFEVMDRRALSACKTGLDLCSHISEMFSKSVYNDPDLRPLERALASEDMRDLLSFFSPVRKRKPEKRREIRERQSELQKKLIDQQKPILNLVEYNQRVVVDGGAGTGKSLVALEVAKRKAEAGLRVGFLCFNRAIGKWFESEVSQSGLPNLVAGSAYTVMLKITETVVPNDADSEWWENEAIECIQEKLTDPDISEVALFDYLIVDEAQDILARDGLWECLKLLIRGGVGEGRFLFLGDFVNQVLTIETDSLMKNLKELQYHSALWKVDENCRNYKEIGDLAITLSAAYKDTWSGYKRSGGSLNDWDLRPYKNDSEQVDLIKNCIQEARNNGFKNQEITLLTFCAVSKSICSGLSRSGVVMDRAEDFEGENIRYSTVNGFKGLESKVVIITDVVLSPQSQDLQRKVFYTGITRATEKLYIYCKESSALKLLDWIS